MFQDVIGAEAFRNFTLSFSEVGILPHSRVKHGYAPLWLFNLAGFLIFFSFVSLARDTALGESVDFSADRLGAVVAAYILLLGLAGIFGFVFVTLGAGYETAVQIYDRVIICVMIGLVVMGADLFFRRALYDYVSNRDMCPQTLLSADHCADLAESSRAALYVFFGWCALTLNSIRMHFAAFARKPKLLARAAVTALGMLVVVIVVGSQIVRGLVLSTAIILTSGG